MARVHLLITRIKVHLPQRVPAILRQGTRVGRAVVWSACRDLGQTGASACSSFARIR